MQGSPVQTASPLEPDQLQHNCPATCVITQQYSSPTLSRYTFIPTDHRFACVSDMLLFKIFNLFYN
jgi:hypothetical protein